MTWEHGGELYVPRQSPERSASVLRQAVTWHRGGSVGDPYIVRNSDDDFPSDCDIAFSLGVLVNGNVTLSDPDGYGVDVFEFAGQRFRPVKWDLKSHALVCWRV